MTTLILSRGAFFVVDKVGVLINWKCGRGKKLTFDTGDSVCFLGCYKIRQSSSLASFGQFSWPCDRLKIFRTISHTKHCIFISLISTGSGAGGRSHWEIHPEEITFSRWLQQQNLTSAPLVWNICCATHTLWFCTNFKGITKEWGKPIWWEVWAELCLLPAWSLSTFSLSQIAFIT